ncbi:MAG TPA: peptidoglycan-binding protein [Acidimicrobiales bacterium]|nr:peptidoglycan-binding protein [Acidimicrobiales bacterium]
MLRGDDIVEVQRQLGALGFHTGRADGIFGPGTHEAVQAFQRNAGLRPDGTVGLQTVSALRRLRSRGPAGDPGALRETTRLEAVPPSVREHHIVVAELGGLGALARETQRSLSARGGRITLLAHPDAAALAEQANNSDATLCIGLGLAPEGRGCHASYWGAHGNESPTGRRISNFILEELSSSGAGVDGSARAMNVPFLRATRMPAVFVDIGPARFAVERGAEVAEAIGRALDRWAGNTSRT